MSIKKSAYPVAATDYSAYPAAVSDNPLARFEQQAVLDRGTALLAKSALDNTACLAAYAEQLTRSAPGGTAIYQAIVKAYGLTAAKRILDTGGAGQ